MNQNLKLCIECKWCLQPKDSLNYRCTNPKLNPKSLVDGHLITQDCELLRLKKWTQGGCDIMGNYWEPKE